MIFFRNMYSNIQNLRNQKACEFMSVMWALQLQKGKLVNTKNLPETSFPGLKNKVNI